VCNSDYCTACQPRAQRPNLAGERHGIRAGGGSVEQGVELTAIFRCQRVTGAQRGQDFLEHLTRLTVGGVKIFLQVYEKR